MKKEKLTDETFYALCDEIVIQTAEKDVLEARLLEAKAKLDLEFGAKIKPLEKAINSDKAAARKYATLNRTRLLGDAKSAKTKAAHWGFEATPAKVIPITKTAEELLVNQLVSMPGNKGKEYLSVIYKLDKSKIGDAIDAGVKWICSIFQKKSGDQFFVNPKADKEA